MAEWGWLVGTLTVRSLRADRRTAALSVALVGFPAAVAVGVSPWLEGGFSVAPLVAVLTWVALAVGDPARATLAAHLWVNGGRAGTRVGLVVVPALALGALGTGLGIVAGLAAAGVGAALTGGPGPTARLVAGVVAAGVGGALAAGLASSLRALRSPSLARLEGGTPTIRVHWWWLVIGVLVLGGAARMVALFSSSFWIFSGVILVAAPWTVGATLGVASVVLGIVAVAARGTTGPSWFALRTVGRDRRRTGPTAGLVAVVVGICAVGAIFQASFSAREARAARDIAAGARPAWARIDPTELDTWRHRCEEWKASGATTECPFNTAPRPPGPESLRASPFIMERTRDAWLLGGAAALFLVPVIGLSVALSAGGSRRRDDALLALQGAPPGWTRRASALEALVTAAAGAVTGVVLALATVGYGFSVYNGSTRGQGPEAFPTVPFVVPWGLLGALVLLVPLLGAAVAAWWAPRDDPAALGVYAEATAPLGG